MKNNKFINQKTLSGFSAFTVFFNLQNQDFYPDVTVDSGAPKGGEVINNNNQILNQSTLLGQSAVNLSLAINDVIDLFFSECITASTSPTQTLVGETSTRTLAFGGKYFVLFKIMIDEFQYKTLHKGKVIGFNSKKGYKELLLESLSLKGSDYTDLQPIGIVINYFELPEDWKPSNDQWTEIVPSETKKVKLEKFGKFNLPIDRDYNKWGTLALQKDDFTIIQNKRIQYLIHNEQVEVLSNGIQIFSFSDSTENCGSADFVRIIDNKSYYIKNNEILLTTKVLPTSFLSKLDLKKDKVNNKIITFDIETLLKDNVHKPYLYSMFDGKQRFSWFTDSPDLLFKQLLKRKYKGFIAYAHNLSRFDIVFLFNHLSSLQIIGFKIKILKKDDQIISINISNRKKGISLTIRDSFLLLPSSLSKLSVNFNIETPKLIEPVLTGGGAIQNPEFAMEYLSHYNKDIIRISDFKVWKEMVQKYCEVDCIALHQVLIKFNKLIHNKWGLNINKYPTIPSLAFGIYRTHYMPAEPGGMIPLTNGQVFDFIKESFTGGATEMYIPYVPKHPHPSGRPLGRRIRF